MTQPRRIVATTSLWIICKEAFVPQMNASLATIDSGGSTEVLSSGLCAVSAPAGPIVARWTGWNMDDDQRSRINQVFGQQGWRPLRGTEGTVLQASGAPANFTTSVERFFVFDGAIPSEQMPTILFIMGITPQQSADS